MKRNSVTLTPFAINKETLLYSGMVYINPQQEFVGKNATHFPLYVRIKSLIYTCGII
jgi:hypothetical protein